MRRTSVLASPRPRPAGPVGRGAPPRRRLGASRPYRPGRLAGGLTSLALLAPLVLGACGGGGSSPEACEPVRREPLDRRAVHVLPGAEEVDYITDPPTSGPHLASPSTSDLRDSPLAPAVQVGLLEEGRVVVQHHGLEPSDRYS